MKQELESILSFGAQAVSGEKTIFDQAALFLCRRQRCPYCAAAGVPHDHHQGCLQVLHSVFYAAQGKVTDEVACVADDEQLPDAGVEDVLRRHTGVAAADNDRQGRLTVFGCALPQLLAQHRRIGRGGLVAAVALHEPV